MIFLRVISRSFQKSVTCCITEPTTGSSSLTLTRESSWQPLGVSCGRPESLSSPHRRHDCTIRFLTSSPKYSRQSMHVADLKSYRLCYLAWKCFILLPQLKGECEWRWVAVEIALLATAGACGYHGASSLGFLLVWHCRNPRQMHLGTPVACLCNSFHLRCVVVYRYQCD